MQESTYNELADLALRLTGQSISPTKAYLIEARLSHISRRESFATLDDLVHCLKARPNQRFEQEIAAAMTSKQTNFFRHRDQSEQIVTHALPLRLKQSTTGRLRILCAGVATGQEVWSLAMRLHEDVGSPLTGAEIEITGTDISTDCVEHAQRGVYGHYDVQKGLSIHRLMTNFQRANSGDWTVSDKLRDSVYFRRHNLLDPAQDLGLYDIIVCTNVLRDMAKPAQAEALKNLSRQLLPDAFLFVGPDEQVEGVTDLLKPSRDTRGAFIRATAKDATAAA